MNITLSSIFVNSAQTLPRYFAQCVALADALHARGDRISFLWGEGDSTDNTLAMLEAMRWRLDSRVVDVTHHGQIFGSVVREERFRQLAGVGRKLWAEVPESADVVAWCESDLIWEPETVIRLIDWLRTPGLSEPTRITDADAAPPAIPQTEKFISIDAIAPPILLNRAGWGNGVNFYDTHAYVCRGRHFEHRPPWHPANDGSSLLEMDTVGSMVAMRGDYFRKAVRGHTEIGRAGLV